jgi:hypothetical protein
VEASSLAPVFRNDARANTVAIMPKMDAGPTDGPPSTPLSTVWVTLTATEAADLLDSLRVWADECDQGMIDPGWHAHITDADGNELTVAIEQAS